MTQLISEKIGRWSLERVRFLLSHIEDFIDDEDRQVRERARSFVSLGGLDQIETLIDADPSDPLLPHRVLDRLSAFFDAGLLLQRSPAEESGNWWTTDLFCRGNLFHLELKDQILAN